MTKENIATKRPEFNPIIDCISVHRPKHKYPQTETEWGAYLSGLIDGSGSFHISKNPPQIHICFNQKDFSLAYKLKKFVGYGTVSKKKGLNYHLTKHLGLIKLCKILIHLQIPHKQQQWALFCDFLDLKINSQPQNFSVLTSHWLAGFIDAGGDLDLLIEHRKDESIPTVNLSFQMDQSIQNKDLLLLLKNHIGGTLDFNETKQSISYRSSSLCSAQKLITYLDQYHLCSNKYKEYVIWRRAFFYRSDIEAIQSFQKRLKTLKKIPKI